MRVLYPTEPGRHIRPAGEDVSAGATILGAGRTLRPADLALAVACGHACVPVRVRPRATIIPTGDEVRPPGSDLRPGEIPDSNSTLVAAMLEEAGAAATIAAHVRDDPGALERAVRAAVADCDLLLVLAGSAGGGRDHTAAVLAATGTVVVRGIALRPAHPVLLAVVQGTPVIGVPGYPVSAALTCERFALPLARLLLGAAGAPEQPVTAVLGEAVLGRRDAELAIPVRLEQRGPDEPPIAWPQSRRGGALSAYTHADATLTVPPGAPALAAGERVRVAPR